MQEVISEQSSTTPDRVRSLQEETGVPKIREPYRHCNLSGYSQHAAGPQVLWWRPANDRTVLWRVATPGVYFNSYSMGMAAWQPVTLVLRRFGPHSCHDDGVYGSTGIPTPVHQA